MFKMPISGRLLWPNEGKIMKQRRRTANNLGSLAEDARALMAATADVAGDKVDEARKRLNAALESGVEMYEDVKEKAVEGVESGDKFVRENPYAALGIGIGVGVLIGVLIGRRR